MNFLESLNMAGKTLLSNKLRSALTMLGIVIGNASVIAMIGIGEGGQRYVNQQLESLGQKCTVCDSRKSRNTADFQRCAENFGFRRC